MFLVMALGRFGHYWSHSLTFVTKGRPGLVKIMLSFAMLILIIGPTIIPHSSGILDFGFWQSCYI